MAVILDIPMPGGCGKCPLNDDEWGCVITGKPVEADSRPETCRLKEVNPIEEALKELDRQTLEAIGIIPEKERNMPDLLTEFAKRRKKSDEIS